VLPSQPRIEDIGALISRPGAKAQRFHTDAAKGHLRLAKVFPSHRLYNVFCPLVDIADHGDGTMLWPRSHLETRRWSTYAAAIQRSRHLEDDELSMSEMVAPACPAGGLVLFDFRLMHRGLASTGRERAIAYAVLSTGWARDLSNFPPDSLWDKVEALPTDEPPCHSRRADIEQRYPLWNDLPERDTD